MTTEAIAGALDLTAKLMELHGENPFKIKALSSAAYRLEKTNLNLTDKTLAELETIEGIGKSIAGKIIELQQSGTTKELTAWMGKTPAGVIELLDIKGIGPKKVGQLWKELQVESPGELLYACYENRLIDLKGFGQKTQDLIRKAIEFKLAHQGKFHYAAVEETALNLINFLQQQLNTNLVALTGAVRRQCEIIEKIEVVALNGDQVNLQTFDNSQHIPIEIYTCTSSSFYDILFATSASSLHLEQLAKIKSQPPVNSTSEAEIYTAYGLPEIPVILREGIKEIEWAQKNQLPRLLEVNDLRGNLHNHSTWSDGMNSIREMAMHAQAIGFSYFGICDHSQSAFYANGLKPERILQQFSEVDTLNQEFILKDFRIFKGIESDITNDGSLDYDDDILKQFDFIVASIHSNLKMDLEKATTRLIRAIENPYTRILGHPTSRLLLSREGYPIDHKKVIDACAANEVAIELNAHPWRLDIDWRWIPYCMEKYVLISINPDAHQKERLADVKWGTLVARKGGLTKENCLNAKSLPEFEQWLSKK
jgi:DNA polymerase (family 10)